MTVVTAVGSVPDFFEYYEEFLLLAASWSPWHRSGQCAFLLLRECRPDLAEQVRTTALDPFYVDDHLPAFFDWLMDNWEIVQ